MTAVRFTFDTEFSGGKDVASEAALGRKQKVMSQSEIDVLRREAEDLGKKAAEVLALQAIAAGAEDAAIAVREALQRADQQVEALRATAAQIAMAAAQTLAGAALSHFAAETVEDALRAAMHQAFGEPRLTLRAAPAVADAIRPRIEEIAHHEGFDGRVAVTGDPALGNADCRIEWRGGGAERVQSAIETALDECLARRFAQTQPIPLSKE